MFFFSEYENLFYGKDRPLYDGTMETARARAEDYAELYILTQRALQEHVPRVKLVGGITGVYSRELTRKLQANPYALGTEDWLESVRPLDPTFVPSAVGGRATTGTVLTATVPTGCSRERKRSSRSCGISVLTRTFRSISRARTASSATPSW